jgi:hypothetical protein
MGDEFALCTSELMITINVTGWKAGFRTVAVLFTRAMA